MSSLTDLFRRYGVRSYEPGEHRNVREGFIGTECPYCVPGLSGGVKMGWRHAGYCTCWSCGRKDPDKTLALLLRVPVEEVRKLDVDRPKRQAYREKDPGVYQEPPGVGPLLKAHRRYLEGRRLDPDEAAAVWGVGGIGHLGGRLAWRLFVPVVRDCKPVSWTTRAVGDTGLRYLSAKPAQEARPMRSTLYGWDMVTNAAVLFEGFADCLAIGPGAVASMGLGYSPAQVALLAGLAMRYICFDNEPAAQRRARQLARQLSGFPGGTAIVTTDTAKDAGAASDAERRHIRRLLK